MLDTTKKQIPVFAGNVHSVEHLDGHSLDRRLRKCSPSQKAVVADDLRSGRLEVGPLTERQARLLARASYRYVGIASRLTEVERLAVRSGGRKLSEFVGKRREPTPAYFDRLMQRYPTQLMAAFDRWTSPSLNF